MTDLDKAREWARTMIAGNESLPNRGYEAAKIIQSLPDQWVSVEEVQEIIEEMKSPWDIPKMTDLEHGIEIATEAWRRRLEAILPAPKLPTLADMTQEEREACRWMQAQTWHEVGIIVCVDEMTEIAQLITRANGVLERKFKDVTPLPDLPKLEWTGSGGAPTIAQKEKVTADQQPNSSETPKSSINPEDVPADEVWAVRTPFADGAGYRRPEQSKPWFVIYPNLAERTWNVRGDSEITLIHKLVAEPPALPEGMRLADHPNYGRVVVSPKVDTDDDYKVFLSGTEEIAGATWKYARGSELTFLDGVDA
ncbi:hypothetical protein [Corynebacterium callunae]|uniref:hypothetical protein n=1 Tax=Corynebacterium callunae TaxID=1721 RepID=UPI001FFE990F|nr:hypothetical protein [Corynebacterium callunae]MCK2200511.1 hypothetical protein [Corynebacterium callunae]